MAEQDMDLSFVISKVSYMGWFFETGEIVRFSACKDDHLEVVGSCFFVVCTQALCKRVSPFGCAFGGNQLPL